MVRLSECSSYRGFGLSSDFYEKVLVKFQREFINSSSYWKFELSGVRVTESVLYINFKTWSKRFLKFSVATVTCSISWMSYAKICGFLGLVSLKPLRSSRSQMFFQISVPKTPAESLFNKVSGLKACNFIKRDSNTGVFLLLITWKLHFLYDGFDGLFIIGWL